MAWFDVDGGAADFSDDDLSKLRAAARVLSFSPMQMADWVEDAAAAAASTASYAPVSAGERAFFDAGSGLRADADTAHVETAAQQQARLLRASLTTKDAGDRLGIGPDAIRHRLGKKQLWSFIIAGQHRIPIWQFVSTREPGYSRGILEYGPGGDRGAANHFPFIADLGLRHMGHLGDEWFRLGDDHGPFFIRLMIHDADGNVVRESDDAPLIADTWSTLPGLEQVVPAVPDGTTPVALEGFMTTPQDELLVGGHPWSPRRWLAEGQDPDAVAHLVADLGTVW